MSPNTMEKPMKNTTNINPPPTKHQYAIVDVTALYDVFSMLGTAYLRYKQGGKYSIIYAKEFNDIMSKLSDILMNKEDVEHD